MANVPLRLDADVKSKLKHEAQQRNRSESYIAATAIRHYLVLRQGCIDGFSWSVSVHGKARLVANGLSPLQEV